NENILESLDDGLVVFDLEERIVRWNRALEGFYGIDREEAIGRMLGEVFDQPFIQALAAAPRENTYGATLYRVPLTSRHKPEAGAMNDAAAPVPLLITATVVPLQDPDSDVVAGAILLI